MNNPCNEDWNGMEPTEQGRFCNSCQKPVIDFTHFTDQQLQEYFLQHPFPVCGRVLHTQRNRQYAPSTPKSNWHLSPVAATLLTLASITTEAAYSEVDPVKQIQVEPAYKQTPRVLSDSVIISGTVKDPDGNPLENAEIIFNEYKTLSDRNGNFQLMFPSVNTKPGIIQFSYGKLERQVRSYHPMMGSANYEVRFPGAYFGTGGTMGIMIPTFHLPDSLTKFSFSFTSSNGLDAKTRTLLSQVAMQIKDNPGMKVMVQSYYKKSKQKATKLLNLVKNYLESEEGIDTDRIVLTNPLFEKQIKGEVIIEFTPAEE